MTEMAITARKARTEPKYKATAAALPERCRAARKFGGVVRLMRNGRAEE